MKRSLSDDGRHKILGTAKHRIYYQDIFPLSNAVDIIIGNDNKIGRLVVESLLNSFDVYVYVDYICNGHHKNVTHFLYSSNFQDKTMVSVEDPDGETLESLKIMSRIDAFSKSENLIPDTLKSVKTILCAEMKKKIQEFTDLTEMYYVGISIHPSKITLDNWFYCLSLTDKQLNGAEVLKSRTCVLDFDIGPSSPLRLELRCVQSFYKYNNLDSLKTLILYELGCFWNITILADFVHDWKHTASVKTFGNLEPMQGSSLLSPIASILDFSYFENRQNCDSMNKQRVFFSGSKGLHFYSNGELLATESSLYGELDCVFNPKKSDFFVTTISCYVLWLTNMILGPYWHPEWLGRQNRVLKMLNNFVSLAKMLNFDTFTICQNLCNAKLHIHNNITTKSSLGDSLSKMLFLLGVKIETTNFCQKITIFEYLQQVVDAMVIKPVCSPNEKYNELPQVMKHLIRDFVVAFLLFNPLLVGDNSVHNLNQRLRVPFSYHQTSGMVSFEIKTEPELSSMKDDHLPLDLTEIISQVEQEWEKGKELFDYKTE